MQAFRIADRRHPIFDGTGARLAGGRWNSPGHPVIYAAETFSGALLEMLVHSNLNRLPRSHAYVHITIPDDIAIERLAMKDLPGWHDEDEVASRSFGDRWSQELRTAVLLVPSSVTWGIEHNVLIHPLHPEFAKIRVSQPQDVIWDERLFRR
jgi:RES domain-containing protein